VADTMYGPSPCRRISRSRPSAKWITADWRGPLAHYARVVLETGR
jgi:hypothetical protein